MYADHTGSFHLDYRDNHPRESSLTQQQMANPSGPHNIALIGQPIHFGSGQFAGQTIRAELREVQKADLGRKYARVDRRPLDPPPAVLLRLFSVYNAGTERESEKEFRNYDEIQLLGLVCTVDLFPVPGPDSGHPDSKDGHRKPNAASASHSSYSSPLSSNLPPNPKQHSFTLVPSHTYPGSQHFNMSLGGLPPLHVPPNPASGYLHPCHATSDVVSHMGDFPITESSKLTPALVGTTFVQPASVDYQGRKSLMFVFADLAVKIEGTFILRYRTFDIFSKPYGHSDSAIQAECYGGMFRVYSTKEFPGLQASTELTKQLARWGVRLNIRETERKRRKKGEAGSRSSSLSDQNKRKRQLTEEKDNVTSASDRD